MPQNNTCTQPELNSGSTGPKMGASQNWTSATVTDASLGLAVHNGESDLFAEAWPTSFSKGLPHDVYGIVDAHAYSEFIEEITEPTYTDNAGNRVALFDMPAYTGPFRTQASNGSGDFRWRSWDEQVAGRPSGLRSPDAGAVSIAPAPRLGSDELAAEMAEVYAMAYLRDMPFEAIRAGQGEAGQVADALAEMAWFRPDEPAHDADGAAISKVSKARRVRDGGPVTPQTLFRGSTPGCATGPYLSQFLVQGHDPLREHPTKADALNKVSGDGTKIGIAACMAAPRIDHRITPQKAGVDYLRDWAEWLDVQNGADTTGEQAFEPDHRKFIETPRDLAGFVHFNAIYQAYLNTCLIMLGWGATPDFGRAKPSVGARANSLTGWRAPQLLTLLTDTATRAMRAVKSQTFRVHNRARPEKLAGVACLVANGYGPRLRAAAGPALAHVEKLETAVAADFSLMQAIARTPTTQRFAQNAVSQNGLPVMDRNLLLPMAFPEGSCMHPSYGSNHAAVAGACVTVLKAVFRTHDEAGHPLSLADAGAGDSFVTATGGKSLNRATRQGDTVHDLTLNGELNKLATNISMGCCMAGVHFYSDYFDSLRMGERLAVGVLAEQLATSPETMRMTLETFDGDRLAVTGNDRNGSEIEVQGSTAEAWWTRHLSEQAGW